MGNQIDAQEIDDEKGNIETIFDKNFKIYNNQLEEPNLFDFNLSSKLRMLQDPNTLQREFHV